MDLPPAPVKLRPQGTIEIRLVLLVFALLEMLRVPLIQRQSFEASWREKWSVKQNLKVAVAVVVMVMCFSLVAK